MKERIIVYGLGREYELEKDRLFNQFNVVGLSDRELSSKIDSDGLYIYPDKLQYIDNIDKIVICSRRYFDDIKMQLIQLGIEYSKLVGLDYLTQKNDEKEYLDVISEIEEYRKLENCSQFKISADNLWIITGDKGETAAKPTFHYFAQDLWGGRKIFENHPQRHYDIGSRIDGFIAHLLVFMDVYYIDIRPLPFRIPHLHYVRGNAMNMKEIETGELDSLSSFHAIEHFGLGRYGDPIDPNGHIKAANEMMRVLCPGGKLYLGLPVGPRDRLVFNAHRIFAIQTVLDMFSEMEMSDIAIIDPDSYYEKDINERDYPSVKNFSCGLFEFTKRG